MDLLRGGFYSRAGEKLVVTSSGVCGVGAGGYHWVRGGSR